ncbi:MAG: hypothetical protein WBZ00_12200 [Solirubrobacterales bacterium]
MSSHAIAAVLGMMNGYPGGGAGRHAIHLDHGESPHWVVAIALGAALIAGLAVALIFTLRHRSVD